MAKLQNYKIEIAKSSSVHELDVTEIMLTDARSNPMEVSDQSNGATSTVTQSTPTDNMGIQDVSNEEKNYTSKVIDMELLEELGESKLPSFYRLCIISRRAYARAGTRYKRRGLDEEEKVANYVETEQIVLYHSHALSFVQVRGSTPILWSQPGLKYRPPPRIDRSEADNQMAFSKHLLLE